MAAQFESLTIFDITNPEAPVFRLRLAPRRHGQPGRLADGLRLAHRFAVTMTFKQTIGANEALRTGTYSKTLTFTLSTTTL